MTSNIKSTRDIIAAKLAMIQNLYVSYDYTNGKPSGYPFATVTPKDGNSEWGDSVGGGIGRNKSYMRFGINIYQEKEGELFGASKAENVLVGVVDEILTAFHMDTTLSGAVLSQRPIEWVLGYDDDGKIVRSAEITLEVFTTIDSK